MNFYIVVNPVGSKFAKALQQGLRALVPNAIYRVDHQRAEQIRQRRARKRLGFNAFNVTPTTLNKIQQFQRFKEHNVSCPAFTTSPDEVANLGSKTVFARTLVNSTGGKGIVEFDVGQPVPRAPLYTAYIPKKAEYRVHVFNGRAIDLQQKKKKREFAAEERDTRVRNLLNGYVYTREGIQPPEGIQALAIAAVAAVGYQYGAVDIVYNEKKNQCYVLEVNSRPGLMGTTLINYVNAVKEMVR